MANQDEEWIYGDSNTPETTTEPTTTTEADSKGKVEPTANTDTKPEVDAKSGSKKEEPKEPETPKAALSNDINQRGAAFAKLRHKYESKVAKAERERDALRQEIEALKKEQAESKSYIESSLIGRDIKKAERQLAAVETPDMDWEESNELAIETAQSILPQSHLEEYKTRIAPYRSNLYKQLDNIAPKLSEYLKESDVAPAIELALASPHANEILRALNSSSYRECARRCEDYVNRLFPKQELTPAPETPAKGAKETKKVSTPSVSPRTTSEPPATGNSLADVASWF